MKTQPLKLLGDLSKAAKGRVAQASHTLRNCALESMVRSVVRSTDAILSENARDMAESIRRGAEKSYLDRLQLDEERLEGICAAIDSVINLPDPLTDKEPPRLLPSGIEIRRRTVPLGVLGIIYEGRPNVTLDCAALAIKSGNCVILRGSKSAFNTNRALVQAIRTGLESAGLPIDSISLLNSDSRKSVEEMLCARDIFDVVIPRGGPDLISFVCETATVPVIETGAGVCHLFVDQSATLDMAINIALNGKTQRPSVCNALETILVHQDWGDTNVVALIDALKKRNVEVRGCERIRAVHPHAVFPASACDWSSEYLDLTISIAMVKDVLEALDHISTYGTKHSEVIVTEDERTALTFLNHVDAAAVYHNASTRFTDGFEYGFGAEIGISTQKLHARGPMGLEALTTYKYLVKGNGAIRA